MSAPRRRLWSVVVLIAVVAGSVGSEWRVNAQSASRTQATPTRPAPVTNGERGATYDWLESKATRVTTRFADAVTTAERRPDGRVVARVADLAGNELATVRVDRGTADSDSLEFALPDGTRKRQARRQGISPTLDWSSQQAYSFSRDGDALLGPAVEWQDTLMRPRRAKRRDLSGETLQTDTEWPGGLSATATRKVGTHVSYQTGRVTTGAVLISRFKQDGVEIGSSQWWPQEQTFVWSFPGLTDGYIDTARLKHQNGWSFTPDLAWLNTQGLAFFQFHSAVNARGSLSERRGGWLEKIGAAIMPTLHAEVGCDGLHWLDQSIYRPCCDSHDSCYAKSDAGCGAFSWWLWSWSWRCDACNLAVMWCFGTSTRRAFQRTP